jgi:DNA-binding MurR/RpiR family transcriptional regulator
MALEHICDASCLLPSLEINFSFSLSHTNAAFMVRMADQRKVQTIALIRNLKVDLARCSDMIFVIVQNMKDRQKAYFMLLGKPWLKQAKVITIGEVISLLLAPRTGL